VITPGAVKYIDFRAKQGRFTSPEMGSNRASGSHYRLKRGEKLRARVNPDGEQFLFVWRGAIQVKHGGKVYEAGERDAVFVTEAAEFEIAAQADNTELIQVEAPPGGVGQP
jgi:quercetin dioxygenase-like cupin family protein